MLDGRLPVSLAGPWSAQIERGFRFSCESVFGCADHLNQWTP